jgi:hypothetical protein
VELACALEATIRMQYRMFRTAKSVFSLIGWTSTISDLSLSTICESSNLNRTIISPVEDFGISVVVLLVRPP